MSHSLDISPHCTNTSVENITTAERKHLTQLLTQKLHNIPPNHLPSITLDDVLHQTARTRLRNVPQDIGLEFLLRHRARIDNALAGSPERSRLEGKDKSEERDADADIKITRAIWFYRLDPVRQFPRWHDGVRWNIAIFTALLTQHALHQNNKHAAPHSHSNEQGNVKSSPRSRTTTFPRSKMSLAAVRFMTAYLAAVVEHHSHLSSPATHGFEKRERFVKLWRTGSLELFTIYPSWAKKALKRALKQLSADWERELEQARDRMGKRVFEEKVGAFVGSLVPGRLISGCAGASERTSADAELERDVPRLKPNKREARNVLLDALLVPYRAERPSASGRKVIQGKDEDRAPVCDLRTAISCVQIVRPRDMLPVLTQLISSVHDHC